VSDWVASVPDVFIASAIADSGVAVQKAVEDLVGGTLKTGVVEKTGLARPDAVRLTISSTVPANIRQRVDELAERIKTGVVSVSTVWDGPEFANPA
jgi:basic membrane protein A